MNPDNLHLDSNKHVIEELQALKQTLNSAINKGSFIKVDSLVYSNSQLSNILSVTKGTLSNWRNQGLISYSKIGKTIIYSKEDVQEFLSKHKQHSF